MATMTPLMSSQEKPIPRPYKCPYPLCGRAFSRLEHQVRVPLHILLVPLDAGATGFLFLFHHISYVALISDSPHPHPYWRKAIYLFIPNL